MPTELRGCAAARAGWALTAGRLWGRVGVTTNLLTTTSTLARGLMPRQYRDPDRPTTGDQPSVLEGVIVPPSGPTPNPVLLIGEAPGREEAARRAPFVGRSGLEQEAYLSRHNLSARRWRKWNVVNEYHEGNPDPTPAVIRHWGPKVEHEVATCKPRLIVAVGRFAMRWFLGDDATLDACHGIPHLAGAFDPLRRHRGGPNDATILPIHHPAGGFYDNDARAVIAYDYKRVAEVLKLVEAGKPIPYPVDEHEGSEDYRDVTGAELGAVVAELDTQNCVLALDTEGSPDQPWSIQVSTQPGNGYLLRTAQPDFRVGANAVLAAALRGATIVMHNAMYDLGMCRAMGVDFSDPRVTLFDTMYAAYLLRLEPQGLKPLAYRQAGMRMTSYEETVGTAARDRQLSYLLDAMGVDWGKPDLQVAHTNDGQWKPYQPQGLNKRVEKIVADHYATVDTDTPTDLHRRWQAIDPVIRRPAEVQLGPFPRESLEYLPLERATRYACRDTDATLRIYPRLDTELARRDLTRLMREGMEVLPVFEEMQSTGMPASRRAFESLRDEMTEGMEKLQARISVRYYGGKPFNPKSPKQTAAIVRRRGLESAKRTATGAMSTGKTAIEHLRYEDPAIDDILAWREYQHTRDMFAIPTLELMPEDVDICTVNCRLLPTRTTTRRLASKDPNLLAMSKHEKQVGVSDFAGRITDFGYRVRDCYVCPPGETFAEWDFSQIEMRFLAHESGDELLCSLFLEERDVHTETAARVFGIPTTEVTKVQRTLAKRVGFGIAYGVSGMGLETQLRMMGIKGWTSVECDKMIREWLKLYKGCADYFNRVEADVANRGYVRDCWGMYRYLPGVWSIDRRVASEARRQAVNHRIQGGAQGLIQRSMAYLRPIIREWQRDGLNVRWCLQVHDAILLRFDEVLWDALDEVVMDAFRNHCGMRLKVPVEADSKKATSWGGL